MAITGNVLPENIDAYRAGGLDDVLLKPLTAVALMAALTALKHIRPGATPETRGGEGDVGAAAPPSAPVDATRVEARRPLRILVVDDAPTNRKMLRRMLEAEPALRGCTIAEAADGAEALMMVGVTAAAVEEPSADPSAFDLIFMDSIMSVMHGPETTRRLREDLKYTGRILGLTGNAMPEDVDTFTCSGLDRLLLKPLKRSTLLEALGELQLVAVPARTSA